MHNLTEDYDKNLMISFGHVCKSHSINHPILIVKLKSWQFTTKGVDTFGPKKVKANPLFIYKPTKAHFF
jgi:hypothetical protein